MWTVIISILSAIAASAITTKFLMEQHFKIMDEFTSSMCNETKQFVKKVEAVLIQDVKKKEKMRVKDKYWFSQEPGMTTEVLYADGIPYCHIVRFCLSENDWSEFKQQDFYSKLQHWLQEKQ